MRTENQVAATMLLRTIENLEAAENNLSIWCAYKQPCRASSCPMDYIEKAREILSALIEECGFNGRQKEEYSGKADAN
jgi:hypothetical protein